jgi:hypothetical protein
MILIAAQFDLDRDTDFHEIFHGLSQSLHANIGTVPQSTHDRFLSDPFEFVLLYDSL